MNSKLLSIMQIFFRDCSCTKKNDFCKTTSSVWAFIIMLKSLKDELKELISNGKRESVSEAILFFPLRKQISVVIWAINSNWRVCWGLRSVFAPIAYYINGLWLVRTVNSRPSTKHRKCLIAKYFSGSSRSRIGLLLILFIYNLLQNSSCSTIWDIYTNSCIG